jgi:hypothetical protein
MEFRDKILGFLAHGESVQIVAPAGWGKSRFGRSLGGTYLDFNLVINKTPETLANFVKEHFAEGIMVLDSLDRLLTTDYLSLFNYLKALRDAHKYKLTYVFLLHKPIGADKQNILGDCYEIASEHIEYLPTLSPKDCDFYKLSGGIAAFEKICMIAKRDGISLDPEQNPKLKAQLEEMLVDYPDHPAYAKSSIIQDYLATRKNTELSAAETRLLELLKSKSGQIVSKDEIAGTIYPDIKNYNGVSDHALDQLIHRLRSKIKDLGSNITTHRGLGYKLS